MTGRGNAADPFAHIGPIFDSMRDQGRDQRAVRLSIPPPMVAFSRRDSRAPGFDAAAQRVRHLGFLPVIRPVGGTFAPMDSGSIVVDELGFSTGEEWPEARYARHTTLLIAAFRRLGVEAEVGEIPGEYCPGRFSIHHEGRIKLSGTAQRVSRGSWVVSTTVRVRDAAPLRPAIAACADALDAEIDPARAGSLVEAGSAGLLEEAFDALLDSFAFDGAPPLTE